MDVFLLNTNPVVKRLVELCANQVHIDIVNIKSIDTDRLNENTILIIDDALFDEELQSVLESTHLGYRVLLVSKGFNLQGLVIFDEVVQKPFLPSRIIDILTYKNKIATKDTEIDTQILDKTEVEKIKNILDESEDISKFDEINDIQEKKLKAFTEHLLSDGVEITNEEEYIQSITKKPKKYKKALKSLIDDALDEIIDSVGKDSFKQAIKEDRVSIEFHIKEKEL